MTIRPDGVVEINVWGVITTADGANISMRIAGLCNIADGIIRDDHVSFQTRDERYKWLCDKIVLGFGKLGFDPLKNQTMEGLNFEVDYFFVAGV